MNKSIGLKIIAVIFTVAIAGIFCIPTTTTAQCKNCGENGHPNPHFPPTDEGAIAFCNKLKMDLKDTTLDNVEDSTSKRLDWLNSDAFDYLPGSTKRIYEKHLFPVLAEVVKNDPFPVIREWALSYIQYYTAIPKKQVYEVYTSALDDPNFTVRATAATLIVTNCKKDSILPNLHALQIVKDVAAGKDRNKWNIKGHFAKAQYQADSGIANINKNIYQRVARTALDAYGINAAAFLDSVSKHGETEELRKSAKRCAQMR